jgi:hypothetical protein
MVQGLLAPPRRVAAFAIQLQFRNLRNRWFETFAAFFNDSIFLFFAK